MEELLPSLNVYPLSVKMTHFGIKFSPLLDTTRYKTRFFRVFFRNGFLLKTSACIIAFVHPKASKCKTISRVGIFD